MKSVSLLCCLVLLVVMIGCASQQSIIGVWQTTQNEHQANMTFTEGGKCIIAGDIGNATEYEYKITDGDTLWISSSAPAGRPMTQRFEFKEGQLIIYGTKTIRDHKTNLTTTTEIPTYWTRIS
jgi:hypothetical protein